MSLTVFLNMVVEIMPVTSDNPLLGKKENQVKNLEMTRRVFTALILLRVTF